MTMKRSALIAIFALCLVAGLVAARGQALSTSVVQLNTATFTSLGSAPQLVQAIGGSIVVIVSDTIPSPTAVGYAMSATMVPQSFAQADTLSLVWARAVTGQAQAVVTQSVAGLSVTGVYTTATIGTTDETIVAAGTALRFLDIRNLSATATVCVNFGAAATISGTACAAGEIAIPPLWRTSWNAGDVIPADAVHAIASAASTPASVGAK